jgi:beta-glucosidase
MKKFKNLCSLILLIGLTAQSIQPFQMPTFQLSENFKKTLVRAGIVCGGLYATHLYKKYVEPQRRALPNFVPAGADNGPQILGDAIAEAVNDNPFFKKNPFFWGVSSACSQNEADNSKSTVSQKYINKHLPKGQTWEPLGEACLSNKFWGDDNKKVEQLGCTMYRFSVDWSRIEPSEGNYRESELNRYAAQCTDLIKRGITPMICFHHYADPIWFMDNGGFEDSENAQKFVQFAEKVITKLATVGVRYWLVMNQPLAYVNKGYFVGMHAPFKKKLFNNPWTEIVKQNIFASHEAIFEIIKTKNKPITRKKPRHKVGISHQITPMRANRYWSIIDPLIGFFGDRSYNGAFLNFASSHKKDFDFMALSFYSPCRFKLGAQQSFWNSERVGNETDDPGRIIDARGFYDAIVRVANSIGKEKPIIFIETGLDADETKEGGTERRINYFNKTVSALAQAIRDGYNVQGFCVWTLMDNYEWGKGYTAHFGLYTRRRGRGNMGEMKPGGKYYKDIIAAYNQPIQR